MLYPLHICIKLSPRLHFHDYCFVFSVQVRDMAIFYPFLILFSFFVSVFRRDVINKVCIFLLLRESIWVLQMVYEHQSLVYNTCSIVVHPADMVHGLSFYIAPGLHSLTTRLLITH